MLPYYKMTKTGKIFNKAKRKFYFVSIFTESKQATN